jgi:fatty acid amide hydrolase
LFVDVVVVVVPSEGVVPVKRALGSMNSVFEAVQDTLTRWGVPKSPALRSALVLGVAATAAMTVRCVVDRLNDPTAEICARAQREREEHRVKAVALVGSVTEKLVAEGKYPEAKLVFMTSATGLAKLIAARKLSSEGLVAFYANQCLERGYALNAITEELFLEALEEARGVDKHFASGGAPVGPLHGVPVSIKDQHTQRGTFSSMGSTGFWSWGRDEEDGLILELVRSTGAIPFVRSTTPQLLMAPETISNIWGTTQNPIKLGRSAGGSSGGEAALVGGLCSPLGMGGDIGGSLRIPATFCGAMSLKMTPQRVTRSGLPTPRGPPLSDEAHPKGEHHPHAAFSGNEHILSVVGPICRHVDDVEAVCAVLVSDAASARDPTTPPVPWKFDMAKPRRLRVGVMRDGDKFVAQSDASKRAVDIAAEALRAAGHTVVDFDPVAARVNECALGYLELMSADGNMAGMRSGLRGEGMNELYSMLAVAAASPAWLRQWVICPVMQLMGQSRMAQVVWASRPKTVLELWKAVGMRDARRKAFLAEMNHQGIRECGDPLDLVLCPAFPTPAIPHKASTNMSLGAAATYVWNYLHVPAGVLPVTQVLPREARPTAITGELGKDRIGNALAECLTDSEGLPMSVQLVGRPFDDETVVSGMRAVKEGIKALTGSFKDECSMPLVAGGFPTCL